MKGKKYLFVILKRIMGLYWTIGKNQVIWSTDGQKKELRVIKGTI